MVQFVDVQNLTAWLAAVGVEEAIAGMTTYIETDFRRWESFERTPRVASHSHYGVIELMPTSDDVTYSFKYVNGHPVNTKANLQTVTAFGVLADVSTGYPTFLTEMTVLTAMRTAATSAMAAKLLAPPEPSTMALIGAGSQAEFQALGFRSALGISSLRIWDTDPEATATLISNLEPLGFDVTTATGAEDAISGADIITTCTADKSNATILTDQMITSPVHINAIGGDCPGKTELDASLVQRAAVFVEHTEQTRIEGEIQQLSPNFAVTEIWQVLTKQQPGRSDNTQVTIFDSVGFAIEDFAALRFVRDRLKGTAYVQDLDLVAEPADPKNLFGLIPHV